LKKPCNVLNKANFLTDKVSLETRWMHRRPLWQESFVVLASCSFTLIWSPDARRISAADQIRSDEHLRGGERFPSPPNVGLFLQVSDMFFFFERRKSVQATARVTPQMSGHPPQFLFVSMCECHDGVEKAQVIILMI
jgi:hypothetical protein